MTIHYDIESLNKLFLSDLYISNKNKYKKTKKLDIVITNLNSIEINRNYYRTGINIKNPKYKKNLSDDTNFINHLICH